MIASGQVKSLGPAQRFMCSASDQSANTIDAGASKVRTMSSSLSAIFFAAGITGSCFELVDVGSHPVEALVPEPPINREPVVDGPEASHFQPTRPPLRLATARDQPGALEHFQVARHRREADLEGLGQLVHRRLALHQ